jgi:predicted phosphoadenosine phosphosulfate sulfurtransferase
MLSNPRNMMPKVALGVDVYNAAKERLNFLYGNFSPSEIWLALSGGKDSTACFYLMKEICLERGIKNINVLIIDLEGHYKLHIDFLESLIEDKDIGVNGYWVCLPFNLSNASSAYMPKWLCWDADKRDKWIRPMPTNRLTINADNNPFGAYFRKGMEFEEFIIQLPRFLVRERGLDKVAQVIGIRTQESYNRYLKMAVRQNREFYNNKQWMLKIKATGVGSYSVHPIYDWQISDVWKYLSIKSYSTVYDKMYKAGYALSEMRICQPYGEEQRDNIDLFAKIEPETWARMSERVYGCNFAKIYKGKHVLKGKIIKPKEITWENWTRLILNTMPPFLREHYLRRINVFLRWWRKELYSDIEHVYSTEFALNESLDKDGLYVVKIHDEQIGDTEKLCPSWRRIAKVLIKGDYLCKNLTFQANKNEYEKLQVLMAKWQ